MSITKCPQCGKDFRYGTEQVGVDSNNVPIFHRFGYCDNCIGKYDIDVLNSKEYKNKKAGKKKFNVSWIVVLATFIIIGAISSSSNNENNSENASSSIEATNTPKQTDAPIIQYTVCNVDEMIDLLDTNALKAEKTYQDAYLEITGKLSNIDSDGSYISLEPLNDKFTFYSVQCYVKNEEQINHILDLKIDDTVTVRVKCKSIGEVMGYSADIIEFVK